MYIYIYIYMYTYMYMHMYTGIQLYRAAMGGIWA